MSHKELVDFLDSPEYDKGLDLEKYRDNAGLWERNKNFYKWRASFRKYRLDPTENLFNVGNDFADYMFELITGRSSRIPTNGKEGDLQGSDLSGMYTWEGYHKKISDIGFYDEFFDEARSTLRDNYGEFIKKHPRYKEQAEKVKTEIEKAIDESEIRNRKDGGANAPTIEDVINTLYSKGKEFASNLFSHKFFDFADTPDFMKKLGITGSKFTIRYGVISRHFGKDGSHDFTLREWKQLPEALKNPFAIAKLTDKENGYRLYTSIKTEKGEYVVVGVDVKNAGRDIEVNAIVTLFGRNEGANLPKNEEVVYRSETITPEQEALLSQPNSDQYPTERESSAGKGTTNSASEQEKGEKNVENRRVHIEGDKIVGRYSEYNLRQRGLCVR